MVSPPRTDRAHDGADTGGRERVLSAAASAATVARRSADRRFFGHPRGLGVLAFSEAWERFSYSGMQTLLVLYSAHVLFQPQNVGQIWLFSSFRALLEAAYGPLTPQGLASCVFGIYAGLVYLTPIVGGVLADRFIGKTRTVILGAVLLTIGHWLMGHPETFLIALGCLVLGVGCFKTNITSQVGDLYSRDDPRRASAFQIFVLAISMAAVVAPLVCGTLGEKVGWKWGFGAAGAGMVVGLLAYLSGRRFLPSEAALLPGRSMVEPRPKLAPGEGRAIVVLVLLLPLLACAGIGNAQMFNAYLLWGEANYSLLLFGKSMPVTWLISLDAALAIAAMSGSLAFWRWWRRHRPEPNEITKLTIGAAICAAAPLVLALASLYAAGGHKLSLGWAVLFHAINEIGYANVYPVGIALYSRCAPRALGGTMIAIFYLHLFAANMLVGWLGSFLPTMSGAAFWLMHATLIASAATILLVLRQLAGQLLAPSVNPELAVGS